MTLRRLAKISAPMAIVATVLLLAGCSSEPSPRQLVEAAAEEYFGESSGNTIYLTGASQMCYDLGRGATIEQAIGDSLPPVAHFYTAIAGPILCPEFFG